jgi:uncharacterized protein
LKFTRDISTTLMIHSVSDREIRIGNNVYSKTIALTVNAIIDDWVAKPIAKLEQRDFSILLDEKPEVIILGTGTGNVFPPRELTFAFARRSIGFEVMATSAAARTFNVLAGENRQVAAVLYL